MATFEEIDFEELEDEDEDKEKSKNSGRPSDFAEIMASVITRVNIVGKLLLFILILVIMSDIFVDKILSKGKGLVEHRAPTSKGVAVQAIFIVLGFSILEIFVKSGLI